MQKKTGQPFCGGIMRPFLKAFATLLFALATISVLAMPAITGLELSTFLITIGSAIATSIIAGILWMLIVISESLDRLAERKTSIPEVQEAHNTSRRFSIVSKKGIASLM
jgi:hypothetical protein